MTPTIYRHKGDFDSETDKIRALNFIKEYYNSVTADVALPHSDTRFYAPSAVFFDTKNVTYNGAAEIKTWMLKLFSAFDKVTVNATSMMVVDESTEKEALYTATVEGMYHFFVKGDPVQISVPRMFIFEIRDSETEDGLDGLQFFNISLYWDTALLTNEIARRREEKK